MDLRGYNLTERPNGKQNYKIKDLVEDLRALIVHLSKYDRRPLTDFILRIAKAVRMSKSAPHY